MQATTSSYASPFIALTHIISVQPPNNVDINVHENAAKRVVVTSITRKTDDTDKFSIGDHIITVNGNVVHTRKEFLASLEGNRQVKIAIERHIFKEYERNNLERIKSFTPPDSLKFVTTCVEKQAVPSGLWIKVTEVPNFGTLFRIADIDTKSPFYGKLNIKDTLFAANGQALTDKKLVSRLFSETFVVVTFLKHDQNSSSSSTSVLPEPAEAKYDN